MGAALHILIPGYSIGMKPDMMLVMAFLAIILFPEKKNVFLIGLSSGVISGLTTTFPAGLIPNIIDKFITCFIFFGLVIAVRKITKSLAALGVLTVAGTLISGTVFLGSAYFLTGLPGAFAVLFGSAVLPAAAANTILLVILYPIAEKIIRRTGGTVQQARQ